MTTNFETRKTTLLTALQELREIALQLDSKKAVDDCEREIRKLMEGRFHLVVLGQFKRGKTTFINSILGEQLLPVAVVPLTSVVTLIRYGTEKRIDVIFENTGRKTITQHELWEYVTEKGNPLNEKNVLYVEIYHPAEFLREGIVFIDTPGIGSMFLHNTETTYGFIPHIDAAIVVLSPDPPLTQAEYEFIEDVKQYVDHIFLVLNKIDILSSEETNDVVAYITHVLQKSFETVPQILPVSARKALEAKETNNTQLLQSSNLPSVVSTISTFLKENKGMILIQASKNRATSIIDEIEFHLELQLKTLQTPLLELENKIREFTKEASKIKKDREEFSYLLQGRVKSLQKWIDEEIHTYGTHLSKQLQKTVQQLLDPIKDLQNTDILEQIKQKAQAVMINGFEKWRTTYEPELRNRYEAIIQEYANKVNECIKKLFTLSAQMFDVRLAQFIEPTELKWKQTFTYKIGSDPLLFDIDTLQTFGRFLPQNFVKRKHVQRIMDELNKNVEQNCGRLSYEYRYSMQESYRTFQYELNARLDQLLDEIDRIFQKATHRRESNAKSVEDDLIKLDTLKTKVLALRERVDKG